MKKKWELQPILLLVGALTGVSTAVAGAHAIPLWDGERGRLMLGVTGFYLLIVGAMCCLVSVVRAPDFVDKQTGQLQLGELWRSFGNFELVQQALAFFAMVYGVTAASNLAELYRLHAKDWHDSFLWSLEAPLFDYLFTSPFNYPGFWDQIYPLLWFSLTLTSAILVALGRWERNQTLCIAVVIAFFLTRTMALWYPTAGPAFYRPELFALEGTQARFLMDILRRYMEGAIPQSGFYPGTMAMPSLHVGLSGLGVWVLAREWRFSLFLTIPWFFLIWMSTIMLGWHYLADGIGGLAVMAVSWRLGCTFTRSYRALMPTYIISPSWRWPPKP